MITFEEIKKQTEVDLKFDKTNLDGESIRIPQLHNKYLCFLYDHKNSLKKQQHAYYKLRLIKVEYYMGRLPIETIKQFNWEPFQLKILKQDLDLYLDSDKDLQQIEYKIENTKNIIEYLENIIKSIMNRHWMIRSAIDFMKFTSGVN